MRIVVVEDEAPIREGMAKLLSKINPEYELVGKAADGEAGYQLIRELNPDLVIMDIRMPKMDGIAMMKKLREENIKCKAIILSAYSEFQYAQKAIELKADSYLLKPIKIPELKSALKQAEREISEDQGTKQIFSVENIMLACMHGQVRQNSQLNKTMQQKYGVSLKEPAELFGVWLGDSYRKQKSLARQILEAVIHMPEDVKECRIHKLLLQPFVENTIKYAFADQETCALNIRMKKSGEQLHILIQDNGQGMDPDMVAKLNQDECEMEGHLGIANVRKRLKLYYGGQAALYFESEVGNYTKVHLFIPIEEETTCVL